MQQQKSVQDYFPCINSENSTCNLEHSSVCGSYHQGCIERLDTSLGMQCSCSALYSLVYYVFKSFLMRSNSTDLDIVLSKGDILYKEQHKPFLFISTCFTTDVQGWEGRLSRRILISLFRFYFFISFSCRTTHDLPSNLDGSTGIVSFIAGYRLR